MSAVTADIAADTAPFEASRPGSELAPISWTFGIPPGVTLPLFGVVLNPRFTRPFYAVPRTSVVGGADKNLDWFYAASPRLALYSMGLREPRDILIRFPLYRKRAAIPPLKGSV